jgi:hypothetical protein
MHSLPNKETEEKTMRFTTRSLKIFSLLTVLLSAGVATAATLPNSAQPRLSNQSRLLLRGIDNVQIGMTVAEASRAAGVELVTLEENPRQGCNYVRTTNDVQGLSFMVTNGKIARIDVGRDSLIRTLSGAKIGDTEDQIKALYPGRIQVSPSESNRSGHYLIFVPRDESDRNYRVIFETDGEKVYGIRSGKMPEVEYSEGCS